jgi:hypothetical protein
MPLEEQFGEVFSSLHILSLMPIMRLGRYIELEIGYASLEIRREVWVDKIS